MDSPNTHEDPFEQRKVTRGNNHRGNPRGKRSSPENRRAQAELMWDDKIKGLTNSEIAKKYNVGTRTVTNRFSEFPKEGYENKGAGAGPADKDLVLSQTAQMWEDKVNHGLTNSDLAEKYGLTVTQVRRRLQGFFPEKPMLALEKHRQREDDKLDMLEEKALEILNKDHYVVDKGTVIMDPYTQRPLVDDAPKLAAMDRMLKIIEAKRKMFGIDSPVKAELTHKTDTTIEVQEVADAVAEAHRRNEERKLRMIQERTQSLTQGEEEIEDAEVVEDGSAPTEDES